MNTLYYGDNLEIMRGHVADESVDLVYLDPPFNSSRTYNLLFKQRKGDDSPAQIMAFEDTWQYTRAIHDDFREDRRNTKLFDLVEGLFAILGKSEMMAYVLMMAPRMLELHRVLKKTGSLYLHCDPVASHYLKIVLDVVFGPSSFRNEISWKRSDAHNDARHQFGRITDRLLLYCKTDKATFHRQLAPHEAKTLKDWYQFLEMPEGTVRKMTAEERETQVVPDGARRFNAADASSPNPRRNLMYEYKGYKPHTNGWRFQRTTMERLDAEGKLLFPSDPNGRIMLKRYLDEQPGRVIGDSWTDISQVRAGFAELRGYPTQKPLALLERIVAASSNEGDLVLDPFCGCGTAVVAAERMKRRWIGIDITYLAVSEIIYRLGAETDARRDKTYEVLGEPKDDLAARAFFIATGPQNHKPFEMWAVSLVEGEPQEKKGADRGVDGRIPIYDTKKRLRWAVIQVKGGHLTSALVREFARVIEREKAPFGIFLCLEAPTRQMRQEAEDLGYVEEYGTRRIPRMQLLTIRELLEDKTKPELPLGYIPRRHQGVGRPKPTNGEFVFDAGEPSDRSGTEESGEP